MKLTDEQLISISYNYKQEASQAKFTRMEQNKLNFDMYHLRQDFDYKIEGQSREFLPKLSMAVEQSANFLQQGLVDIGDWFRVEPEEGLVEDLMRIKPSEIYLLTKRNLELDGFVRKVGDAAKLGLLGSLMIAKVHGRYVPKFKYKAKEVLKNGKFSKQLLRQEDKAWQLRIDLIRQEDFYPDPSGRGLYVAEDIYMDFHEVQAMSKGKDAIYDPAVVEQLKNAPSNENVDSQYKKSRESGQDIAPSGFRNVIKLTEYWGNIIDDNGALVAENVVWTIANDRLVIQKPTENPLWYNQNPYVYAPIISTPNSVWSRALMDAPAMLNRAINEMFNLMLDGGLMSVHGIKQIREHYLEDPSQVEEGVTAGTTLRVKANCPPGAQALERVDTSSIPSDGFNVMNLVNQEFFTSALTSDLRMGVASFRQVKATEVVEASQSITSMFSGMAKQIEASFLTPILQKAWFTIAQHTQDIDPEKLKALLGEERARELQGLTNEELFAETVQGCKFQVFGISAVLNKQRDFTKLQGMLQTISSSPILLEEFLKKGFDFGNLLEEIMKSLDINTAKLKADDKPTEQGGPLDGNMPGGVTDAQSQIPQAGAAGNQGDLNAAQSAIPRTEFPASRANPSGGMIPGA